MNHVANIDRRSFVASAAALGGGFALGFEIPFGGPSVARAGRSTGDQCLGGHPSRRYRGHSHRPRRDGPSQPEPTALGLLRWDLQPLASPDTLDPLVVDYPTRLAQELGDLAIAVAAVLPGKLDNVGGETLLVVTTARDLALRRAMLPERRTGATLGDMQLRSDLLNAGTATRGA